MLEAWVSPYIPWEGQRYETFFQVMELAKFFNKQNPRVMEGEVFENRREAFHNEPSAWGFPLSALLELSVKKKKKKKDLSI